MEKIEFTKKITTISTNKEFEFYLQKDSFQYIVDNIIQLFKYDKTHESTNPFEITDKYFTKLSENIRELTIEMLNRDSEYEKVLPYSLRLLQEGFWKCYQGKEWLKMEYNPISKKALMINSDKQEISQTVFDISELKEKSKSKPKSKPKVKPKTNSNENILIELFNSNIPITDKISKFVGLGYKYSEFYRLKPKYENRIKENIPKTENQESISILSNYMEKLTKFNETYKQKGKKVQEIRKYNNRTYKLHDIYTDTNKLNEVKSELNKNVNINYKTEKSIQGNKTFYFLRIYKE